MQNYRALKKKTSGYGNVLDVDRGRHEPRRAGRQEVNPQQPQYQVDPLQYQQQQYQQSPPQYQQSPPQYQQQPPQYQQQLPQYQQQPAQYQQTQYVQQPQHYPQASQPAPQQYQQQQVPQHHQAPVQRAPSHQDNRMHRQPSQERQRRHPSSSDSWTRQASAEQAPRMPSQPRTSSRQASSSSTRQQSSSSTSGSVLRSSSAKAEYDLIWHRDALAVALRCNSKQRAVIKRIEDQSNTVETTAGLSSAAVNDVLVAINWEDCTSMSWDQVKSRLSERDLPLTLTFRSSSKPEPLLRAEPARSVPVAVPEPEAAEPEPERPRRGSKAMTIPTAFALPPLLANEYNVTWSQGKLGVVVHLEEGGRAVVKERTTPSADPSTGQIEPRDELLYVNDASVASIGYNEALVRMRGKKPIHLRFRRAMASGTLIDTMVEADGPAEPYQLVWKTGPLGIVLKKNKNDEIFVQQLTNKGLSASSGKIAVGDILVAVTGVPTAPLGLAGTVDFLQCIQKPAVLDFEHRRARQPSTAKVEPDVVAPVLTAPTRAPVPSPLPSPKDSFGDDASDQQSIAMMALPDFERSTGTTVVLPGTLGETFLQPSVLLQTQSSMSEETPVLDAEYQVVWTRGKIGVVIHLEDDVRAVVRETTGTATDPNLAQIQARDELIAVNGVLVADVGYAASLQAMKGPKPITLRFCKGALDDDDDDAEVVIDDEPSSTEPVIYSLLWKTGSLGIVLKLNDTDDVYVAQVTGKGLSEESGAIVVGDVLVSVTGVPTKPLGLAGTVDFLKCIQKPAALVFERRPTPVVALVSTQHSSVDKAVIPTPDTMVAAVQTPVVVDDVVSGAFESPVAAREELPAVVEVTVPSPTEEIETRATAAKSIEVLRRPVVRDPVPPALPVPESPLLAPRVSIQPPSVCVAIDSPLASPALSGAYAPLSVIMTPQALPSPIMSPQALPSPIMSPAPVFTPMQSPEVMTPLQSPLSSVHSPMHSTVLTPTATMQEVPAVVRLADDLDDTTREMAPSFTDRASDVSAMTDRASDASPMILVNQDDAMSTLYSIIWTGGPLGIAIKLNRHDEVCVMALTGGGLAGESDIINVGDVLVAVGNVTVRQATLEETSRVLKETPTPVSLVFLRAPIDRRSQVSMDMVPTSARGISTSVDDAHSSPSSSESKAGAIFSVVWEGGPLGIVVRKNAQDENFVKDFTGDGLSAQSDLIRRGDVLISVADVRVRNLSLAAASQVMQSVRKPTFLVFRRQALADANAAA